MHKPGTAASGDPGDALRERAGTARLVDLTVQDCELVPQCGDLDVQVRAVLIFVLMW
jgi:hypothetical protein